MTDAVEDHKLWTHSGDSHFLEPPNLWNEILPSRLASRMPWSEKVSDEEEILHVDGKEYRRPLPKITTKKISGMSMAELSSRPPGARDNRSRLRDLDQEGVWGEVVYSSLGLWESMITDLELIKVAARAENEWKAKEAQAVAPDRLVLTASLPLLDASDAVEAAVQAKELGL